MKQKNRETNDGKKPMRAHRARPRSRRAAEQRDELPSFQWFKWHPSPGSQDRAQQDIELTKVSQRVPE